jgi:hypothetical protein
MFDPNLWYVITQKINTKIPHYETRLSHPWDLLNYTYYLKSAIKLKIFNNYKEARNYENSMKMLSLEHQQLNNLLNNCTNRILEY